MKPENKAILLDRDGVIIHDVHYLSQLDQIIFYEDVANGLTRLKNAGYLLIVVTNQSGVARGYFDEEFVKETHQAINQALSKKGVSIDAFYYCPHHVDGKTPYNDKCFCRKPQTGMILSAKNEYNIDIENSIMIGDKISDVELAINANMEGILLETGQGMQHCKKVAECYPQITIKKNFSEAVDMILTKNH